MKWNGTEGELWLLDTIERGVQITVIPGDCVLDETVLDVFHLNLKLASVRDAISAIKEGHTYTVKDKSARIGLISGSISLEMRIAHKPGSYFHSHLEPTDSESFLEALESIVEQRQSVMKTDQKVPRNALCPCGSGIKYKKCCLAKMQSQGPDELEFARHIKDRHVAKFVDKAALNREMLKFSDFWDKLGRLIGSSGNHETALIAFEKALKIEPQGLVVQQNLAVTFNCLNRHDEALQMIDRIPESTPRKAVIRGNILLSMGSYEEAIPLFEKAIEEEPDFPFPYKNLLTCLKTTDNPLFEYWLEKTVERLPKNPEFALIYAEHLFKNSRIEELAEADWMDKLEIRKDAFDIVGRAQDDPLCMELVTLLRHCASLHLEEDDERLEEALSLLEKLGPSGQACDEAIWLTGISSMQGRPDAVERAYKWICEGCRIIERGVHPFHAYLAHAYLEQGDFELAVKHCEEAQKTDPDGRIVLRTHWWGLDELGQTEQAINIAEKLYELEPDLEHLEYNLGHMCEKVGRLGAAKRYYEKQLERVPSHSLAAENKSFLDLLEQNFDEARSNFEMAMSHYVAYRALHTSEIPKEMDSDELREELDQEIVQPKREHFERLVEIAKTNVSSPTFMLDLIRENDSDFSRIGNKKTTLSNNGYGLDQILNALSSPTDLHAQDLIHQLKALQRGDRSAVVAELNSRIEDWEKLPDSAKNSLIEAESRYLDGQTHDYAPVIVSYAKALEVTLKKNVFDSFRESCRVEIDVSTHTQISVSTSDDRVKKLFNFVEKGTHLELGVMVLLLRLSNGQTASKFFLLQRLRDYIVSRLGLPNVVEKEFLDSCGRLASLRNPAAHVESYGKEAATEARELCFSALQDLN